MSAGDSIEHEPHPMARAEAARDWLAEMHRLDRAMGEVDASVFGTVQERQRARSVIHDTVRSLAHSLSMDDLSRAIKEGRLEPAEADILQSLHREQARALDQDHRREPGHNRSHNHDIDQEPEQ